MKTNKLLSVVLTLCVLLAMCSLAAFAADGVTIDGDTITLTAADTDVLQAVLDGQYGSIDGKTIVLPAGDYGKLELGRATKYAGSNTEYMVGGFDSSAANYQKFDSAADLIAYKNGTGWTPNCFYRRALRNVTLRAADGAAVTVAGMNASAGHIYGTESAHKYDYVLDVEIVDTNKSYYMAFDWSNISFEGLHFSSTVNFESSAASTQIDGVHFADCTFNPGYAALAAAGAADAETLGRGIHFANWAQGESADNLKNLTVDNCRFTDCYQGVYTNPVYGVSVTNSTFTTIKHNAIAIQDSTDAAVDHGAVVITDNVFNDVSDRIIRFNNVGADTEITITGNTTNGNVGDKDNQVIKATTLADGITYNVSGNAWGEGKVAANDALNDAVSTYVAEVGGVQYATLNEAFAAAKDGDTVKLLCDFTTDATKTTANDRLKISVDVTLDLNGHTITVPAELEPTANWSAFYIMGGTMTVKDSVGNGAIRSGNETTLGTYLFHLQGGNLVIESGIFFAGVTVANVQKGTATVNGGSFAVYLDDTTKDARYLLNCIDASYANGTAHIVVNGGTFAGYDPRNNAAEGVGTNFVAPGVGVDAENGSFTAKADMVAQILDADGNSVKAYATLQEAFAAAKDGETVLLLADVEQNSELTIDKSITLDLGGKKIYNTVDIWDANATPVVVSLISVEKGAAVTVTGNGTIAAKDNDCYTFNVVDGNLTIENGSYIGNISVVQVEKGTLTVNGGSFSLIQKMTDGKGADRYLFNCIDDAFTAGDAKVAVSGGTFDGFDPNVSPEAKVDGKTPSFAAPGVGITKNADGSFTAEKDMAAQILDADGNSVKAYATLAEAFAAAKDGETVLLLADTEVSEQLTIGTAIIFDLGGYTLRNAYSTANSYSLMVRAAATIKNGTYKSTNSAARGIGARADVTLDGVTLDAAGLVGLGCSTADCTYTVKNSKLGGSYSLANFANNATISISNSTLEGDGNVLYHNGSNYGLKLTVADSTITSTGSLGVYISGSTVTRDAAGYQQASFTNCTIIGLTAVEVKYTDLVLDNCIVTATDTQTSYVQNNNGPAARGFAVASTDNAKNDTTPKPEGSITIKGESGKYVGPVGLGSLASVKTDFADFDDKTVSVSGGTFSMEVPAEYCADGYTSVKNADGTYTVAEGSYVAEIGNTKYATLQEAFDAAKTGDTVKLLCDITLTEQVNILNALDGLTLDGNGKTITCKTTEDPTQSGGSALYFGSPSSGKWCTGIKIHDLTMVGTARYAIFLSGGTTTDFTNVKISGNYYIAVNLYGTHGATMTNCEITNSQPASDKYSSAVWSNVAAQNPLVLNDTVIDVIAINAYTNANELKPKIFINGTSKAEIHTFDDGSVSKNKKLCVSTESTAPAENYSIQEYDGSKWVDILDANIFGKIIVITCKPTEEEGDITYNPISVYTAIDSLNYKRVGFKYSVEATSKEDGSTLTPGGETETRVVYTAITGTDNDGNAFRYSAENMGADYIYGHHFRFNAAVYAGATTKLIITPYAETLDGVIIEGKTIEISESTVGEGNMFRESK